MIYALLSLSRGDRGYLLAPKNERPFDPFRDLAAFLLRFHRLCKVTPRINVYYEIRCSTSCTVALIDSERCTAPLAVF